MVMMMMMIMVFIIIVCIHKIILNNLKRFSEIDRVKTTDMIMEIFGSD